MNKYLWSNYYVPHVLKLTGAAVFWEGPFNQRTECFPLQNLGTSRVHSLVGIFQIPLKSHIVDKSAQSVQKRPVLHGYPALKMAQMRIRPLPKVITSPCCPSLVNTLFSLDLALYPACCVLTKLGRREPPHLFSPLPNPVSSQHKVPFFINAVLKPAWSCFPDVAMRRQ